MKTMICLAAALALSACSVVPVGTVHQACGLLQIASDEGDLAPAWYIEAGGVLARCGKKDAQGEGERKACFASARSGYRDSKECEALP